MSDGNGAGGQGDIMCVVNVGGTNKTNTVVQFIPDLMCEQLMRDYTTNTYAIGANAITGWLEHRTDAGYTRTASNITVLVEGWYDCSLKSFSFETDGASELECYLYTNETEVVIGTGTNTSTIGWDRKQSNLNADGVTTAGAMMYLLANTRVSWWIETTDEEIMVQNHGTFRVERK